MKNPIACATIPLERNTMKSYAGGMNNTVSE